MEGGQDPRDQRVGSGYLGLLPWSGGSWGGGVCGFRLQVLVHYVLSHWALTQKHTMKEILTKDFKVVNREQKTPSAGPF